MTIQINQVLLLAAILVFIHYVFRIRTIITDRLIFLIFTACGIMLVLRPDLATRIANLIHIGRGADLLLYVFVLFSIFNYVGITSELRAAERRMTEIVREIAISGALEGQPTAKCGEKSSESIILG
jgi:small membrane protein